MRVPQLLGPPHFLLDLCKQVAVEFHGDAHKLLQKRESASGALGGLAHACPEHPNEPSPARGKAAYTSPVPYLGNAAIISSSQACERASRGPHRGHRPWWRTPTG